jgi:hypothetical protein
MTEADDHGHPGPVPDADHDETADHGHGGPAKPLGPVDTRAWAAAIGGSVLAIAVVVALYLAIAG